MSWVQLIIVIIDGYNNCNLINCNLINFNKDENAIKLLTSVISVYNKKMLSYRNI